MEIRDKNEAIYFVELGYEARRDSFGTGGPTAGKSLEHTTMLSKRVNF